MRSWLLRFLSLVIGRIVAGVLLEARILDGLRDRVLAAPGALAVLLTGRRKTWLGEPSATVPAPAGLCIFATYDAGDRVDEYIFYYLEQLRAAGLAIDFVTGSRHVRPADLERLRGLCRKVHRRENRGRDFGHFKYGLANAGALDGFERVVLANDSVYGPLFPLKGILHAAEVDASDFWGVSDSWDVKYHLHSYFLVFKKSCFTSQAFKTFWRSFQYRTSKQYVILQGEIRLSQHLMKHGHRLGVMIPYERLIDEALAQGLEGSTLGLTFPHDLADMAAAARALELVDRPTPRQTGTPQTAAGGDGSTLAELQLEDAVLQAQANRVRNRRLSEAYQLRLTQRIRSATHNSLHYFWKEMITRHRCPFLKIELIRDNPARVPNLHDWRSCVTSVSNYDVNLIVQHQRRTASGRTP